MGSFSTLVLVAVISPVTLLVSFVITCFIVPTPTVSIDASVLTVSTVPSSATVIVEPSAPVRKRISLTVEVITILDGSLTINTSTSPLISTSESEASTVSSFAVPLTVILEFVASLTINPFSSSDPSSITSTLLLALITALVSLEFTNVTTTSFPRILRSPTSASRIIF